MSDADKRLQELADISARRPLTSTELAEAFRRSVGCSTVEEIETFLASKEASS